MDELIQKIAQENMAASQGFTLDLEYFDDQKSEDEFWRARTGLDETGLCGAIETIIFMSDRPVSLTKLRELIDPDMPLRVLYGCIGLLQSRYEDPKHGIRLQEVAEGYQFRTKAYYAKYVQDLFKVSALTLTPAALEVLATIAYKQPVSRTEIDRLRGVDSSHLIRALLDKRLIKIMGRSEELGKPVLYGTTKEFLEVFNFKDLSELPPESELRDLALKNEIGEISDIKGLSEQNSKFFFDELEELDALSGAIKNISPDTPFIESLKDEDKKRVENKEGPIKTAFDILEEYVLREDLINQNKLAAGSNPISELNMDPRVIKNFWEGPFNLPLSDDFEMIDLNTGSPISLLLDNLNPDILSDSLFEIDDSLLEEREKNLEKVTNKTSQGATDLDIDLEFLKDEP
jgi:segregation and condensation protein B